MQHSRVQSPDTIITMQAGVPISGSALDELSAPAAGEVGTDEGL